jgi:hypothetical protein
MFGHVMEARQVHINIFPNYIGESLLFFGTVHGDWGKAMANYP